MSRKWYNNILDAIILPFKGSLINISISVIVLIIVQLQQLSCSIIIIIHVYYAFSVSLSVSLSLSKLRTISVMSYIPRIISSSNIENLLLLRQSMTEMQ